MAKKTASKSKSEKEAVQVKKDAKGRFWLVPKDGGAEQGPYDTKKAALEAKAGGTTPEPDSAGKAKNSKDPKEKKLSAIDAAAQVLAAAKEPMNAKQLIEAMTAKGLWTSPGGKTPHATLYSTIIREISLKGKDSRFVKTERGKFAAK